MKKNIKRRAEILMAMEKLARSINDEDIFMSWLSVGVADGDINQDTTIEELMHDDYYMDDDNFAELMGLFLHLMVRANKSGGLYVGGVVSK